ncbi:MAG: 16S rRNA (cytosine(967)-C(5))-methyltransferase RsmB [Pseudomonadota bacterium]
MPGGQRGARIRAAAAKAVHAVVAEGRSLDAALRDSEAGFSPDELPLLRYLAFGAVRQHFRIRGWLRVLLKRPVKRRDRVIESLIALGLFQLTGSRIPDHAVVSETVEAARVLRLKPYAGLVNAVLRRFRREGLANAEAADDEARCNHPQWIIDRLRDDWREDAAAVLAANDERAPMWLRVNPMRQAADEYQRRLSAAGLSFVALEGLPQAVRLEEAVPVAELPGFAVGDVSVQDGAAQIPAAWLLRDGGRRILDACAAPGGKTAHLLELAEPDATLDAVDIDPARLDAVRANLDRLLLNAPGRVSLHAASAADTGVWWDGQPYDRILLDAPCSASGVIRRHPDIKLLRRDSDIAALARVQEELLERLWPTLTPGGLLLYVTCSVFSAENERVVERFLRRIPDAEPAKLLPNNNISALMRERGTGYQLLPGTRGLDGFFYAAITKRR